MTAKYLLRPSFVRSRSDGEWHFISATKLASLYRVPMSECLILPTALASSFDARLDESLRARASRGELLSLSPRSDGNYALPTDEVPAVSVDAIKTEREECASLMETLREKSNNHLVRSALTIAAGEIRARGN